MIYATDLKKKKKKKKNTYLPTQIPQTGVGSGETEIFLIMAQLNQQHYYTSSQ